MAANYSSGLDASDLGLDPGGSNALAQYGLDPDEVRANPELLRSLAQGGVVQPPQTPSASAVAAGQMGGAAAPPTTTTPPTSPGSAPVPPAAPTARDFAMRGLSSLDTNATNATQTAQDIPTSKLAQGGVVQPPQTPSASAVAAGQMGGAAAPPTTTTPPTSPGSAPVPPAAPTARDFAMRGLSSLDTNATNATQTAQDIPTSNPAIDKLEAKREPLSTPTPLYDPQTGKMLAGDKPSGWTRFGRGLRGAAIGLLTGGIPGAAVGAIEPQDIRGGTAYGAPNKKYEHTEQTRQNQLASVDQSLNEARENWKSQVDAQKAKASEFRANAALGKDETTGGTGVMNADTSAVKEANDNPAAKDKSALDLKQQEYDQRTQQLSTLEQRVGKIPPASEAYFLANGKMPDPKQPREPSAEEIMLNTATSLFKQQNGRRPTYEEYLKLVSQVRGKGEGAGDKPASRAQVNSLNDKKKSAIDKATEAYRKTFDAKAYQQDLQAAQDEFERDAEEFGLGGAHNVVTVDAKGQPVWTPENSPSTQQSAGAAPVPPTPGLQPGEVAVTMPDGSVYAVPKDKVAEAVKRGGKTSGS